MSQRQGAAAGGGRNEVGVAAPPPPGFGNINIAGFLDLLDEKAMAYGPLVGFSNYIGCRPSIIISVGFGVVALALVFGWGGGIICDMVGFLYPAWMSFKAIETPSREDDKLWLTYWVVYAFFSLLEYFIDSILFWVPFYYFVKLVFLLYLCLPWTKGAEVIYNTFIRPYLLKHQQTIEGAVSSIGSVGSQAVEGVSYAVNDGIDLVNQASNIVGRKHRGVVGESQD
eukprot:GHVS01091288.1.p1 GENE.GHVS01091288.1~~GHVS01091288.1.p1  ORF type:complete len:226 (+),score=37.21 GHVS01091288.1:106-783(+)